MFELGFAQLRELIQLGDFKGAKTLYPDVFPEPLKCPHCISSLFASCAFLFYLGGLVCRRNKTKTKTQSPLCTPITRSILLTFVWLLFGCGLRSDYFARGP